MRWRASVLILVLTTASASAKEPTLDLTTTQAARLLERAVEREPFLKSAAASMEPGTMNRFFTHVDYELLAGNPFLGYWHSGTFRWTGDRVAWDGISAVVPEARGITPKAWRLAFELVARKRGLAVDAQAPIRIRGACVNANLIASEERPKPGVELELRIESPTGPLRHRLAVGKPTVEEAMAAVLDWTLGFALRVNQRARP